MFDTPLVDDFNRNESPLSDSGRWAHLVLYTADYLDANTSLGGGFIDHHSFGFGGDEPYAIRLSSPGADYNQEGSFGTNASFGVLAGNAISILLRFTPAGTGYEFKFYNAGAGAHCDIIRWDPGIIPTPTVIASGNAGAVSPSDMVVGARAIGNVLTGYACNVGSSLKTSAVLVATTTDSTYTYGLLGIGSFGAEGQALFGGKTAPEGSEADAGVFVAPWLVAFGSPTPKA